MSSDTLTPERLNALDESDALFLVFDHIDDMLSAGRMSEVNVLIAGIDVSTLTPAVALGFWTITNAAEHSLPARPDLERRIHARIAEVNGIESADACLRRNHG